MVKHQLTGILNRQKSGFRIKKEKEEKMQKGKRVEKGENEKNIFA